jgi:hypothetical protein
MSHDIKDIRSSYRYRMRSYAKQTGKDQKDKIEKGIAFIDALHAAGLKIHHVSWFEQPFFALDDGYIIQNLRTGGMTVHAKSVVGGHAGAQHHKAHPARTPKDAIRLLKGPVAGLTAIARTLCRKDGQADLNKTDLFRSAIDQIAVNNDHHDAEGRLAVGLKLLDLLAEHDIPVRSVTIGHGNILIGLPQGGVTQGFDGLLTVGYAVRDDDRAYDYRLPDAETRDPAEAVRLYIEKAVPMSDEAEAERRREREERQARKDAEDARQADVIARFEALSDDERRIAALGVEYLEVALRRSAGPIGIFAFPGFSMRGGLLAMFDSIDHGAFPGREPGPGTMQSDVFADA